MKDNLAMVEKIFSAKLGIPIRIILKIIDESIPKESQPIIQDALQMFGGKVVKEWHNET